MMKYTMIYSQNTVFWQKTQLIRPWVPTFSLKYFKYFLNQKQKIYQVQYYWLKLKLIAKLFYLLPLIHPPIIWQALSYLTNVAAK